MKRFRKISITSVHERYLIVRTPEGRGTSACPDCLAHAKMVTPENAARITARSVRTIYRWVEAGEVHFIEEPAGVLICVNSLVSKNLDRGSTGV
ncbi:MAG: hypothetical protein AABM67_01940 [Acidobacteriota bacterium]